MAGRGYQTIAALPPTPAPQHDPDLAEDSNFPRLFGGCDLALITASGLDPQVLASLPWPLRRPVAEASTLKTAYELIPSTPMRSTSCEWTWRGDPRTFHMWRHSQRGCKALAGCQMPACRRRARTDRPRTASSSSTASCSLAHPSTTGRPGRAGRSPLSTPDARRQRQSHPQGSARISDGRRGEPRPARGGIPFSPRQSWPALLPGNQPGGPPGDCTGGPPEPALRRAICTSARS
jgi:hypothetical protein